MNNCTRALSTIQHGVPTNVCKELMNGFVSFPGAGKAGINFCIFFPPPYLPIRLLGCRLLCTEWSRHREMSLWPEASEIFIKITIKRMAVPVGKVTGRSSFQSPEKDFKDSFRKSPSSLPFILGQRIQLAQQKKKTGWVRLTDSEVSFLHVWLIHTSAKINRFLTVFPLDSMNSLYVYA